MLGVSLSGWIGSPNNNGSGRNAFCSYEYYIPSTDSYSSRTINTASLTYWTNGDPDQPEYCESTQGVTIQAGGDGEAPTYACINTCQYRTKTAIWTTNEWYGDVEGTGAICTSVDAAPTSENCIEQGGTKLCYKTETTNCGTFNGQTICLDTIPPGNCTMISGGSFICDSEGTPPLDSQSNPQENPYDIIHDEKPYTYYPGNESGPGNTGDRGATSDDIRALGEKLGEKLEGLEAGIDEGGTPTGTDTMFDSLHDQTGYQSLLDGLDTETAIPGLGDGSSAIDLIPIPTGTGSCQQATISFSGRQFTFPSAAGCQKLASFREIFGWALYILTFIAITHIALRRPA